MEKFASQIKDLIAADKIEDALNHLTAEIEKKHDSELHDSVLLLSRRFTELKMNSIIGKITQAEISMTKTDISDSVLNLLEEVQYADYRISETKNATHELKFLINKIKSNKGILADDKPFLTDLKNIFEEIDNTYKVILESVNKYLMPAIGSDNFDTTPYLDFSNGLISLEIDRNRGHCHIISQNYFKGGGVRDKLREQLSNNDVFESFDSLFSRLSDGDNDVFHRIQSIGDFIRDESGNIVEMLMEDKIEEAKKKIREDYKKITPLKKMLQEGMQDISDLKREIGF